MLRCTEPNQLESANTKGGREEKDVSPLEIPFTGIASYSFRIVYEEQRRTPDVDLHSQALLKLIVLEE